MPSQPNQAYGGRTLLTVRDDRGNVQEFDDPKLIGLAVEGFCPYLRHPKAADPDAPVRLEPQSDGSVLCPGDDRAMRFEFGHDWIEDYAELLAKSS